MFSGIQQQINDAVYWTPEREHIVQEIRQDCRRFVVREGAAAATALHRWLHLFRSAASAVQRFGSLDRVLAGGCGTPRPLTLRVAILTEAIKGHELPLYDTGGAVIRLWERLSTTEWNDPDANPIEGEQDFLRSRIAERIFEDLQDEVLTESEDAEVEAVFGDWLTFTSAVGQYRSDVGYVAPKRFMLDAIQEFSEGRIVEGGAGLGHWASLLQDAGCEVVAYDRFPGRFPGKAQGNPSCKGYLFLPIQEGEGAAMAAHPDHTLLLIWPPFNRPMGLEHIEAHYRAGGQKLVYIGEWEEGSCGNEAMFEFLAEHYTEVRREELPSLRGDLGHPQVRFYERRD